MCNAWHASMDCGDVNAVVFLDIRKAFDSINHDILLRKMEEQFGVSNVELKWFESYISNREQTCLVNGTMSTAKKLVCGVPQGSILGPLLYIMISPIVFMTQSRACMLMTYRFLHLLRTLRNLHPN